MIAPIFCVAIPAQGEARSGEVLTDFFCDQFLPAESA
jgi:hypothetical protein